MSKSQRQPTKVYLAAQYERNPEMRNVRDLLEPHGFQVTSRWIDQHAGEQEVALTSRELTADPSLGQRYALVDLADITAAHVVVVFTSGNGGGRGGYHTEFGIALAMGKSLYVVGNRENVFHTMPLVRRVPDVHRLIESLTELSRG